MKNFLSIHDVQHFPTLLELAKSEKKNPFAHQHLGKNKTLVLLFFNPSLRTRLSTQKAAQNLGMNVIVMNVGADSWQMEMEDGTVMNGGTQEHIKEAVAVVSEYADIIGVRTFPTLTDKKADYEEKVLQNFVKYSTVPIISMESATAHPLQGFADALTISELQTKPRPKVVLTWAPHPKALPQAVPNSFARWIGQTEADLVIACPKGYELAPEFIGNTPIVHSQAEALKNADFVCAKSWSSYSDYGKRPPVEEAWAVTVAKMTLTNQAKFMHCLPVRRNVVVTDDVLDSPQSVVIRQSGNRVWSAQAVLHTLLNSIE